MLGEGGPGAVGDAGGEDGALGAGVVPMDNTPLKCLGGNPGS